MGADRLGSWGCPAVGLHRAEVGEGAGGKAQWTGRELNPGQVFGSQAGRGGCDSLNPRPPKDPELIWRGSSVFSNFWRVRPPEDRAAVVSIDLWLILALAVFLGRELRMWRR